MAWDLLKFVGLIALLAAVGTGYLLVWPDIATARCASKWSGSGLSTKWQMGSGCLVSVNGAWVPEANVQITPR